MCASLLGKLWLTPRHLWDSIKSTKTWSRGQQKHVYAEHVMLSESLPLGNVAARSSAVAVVAEIYHGTVTTVNLLDFRVVNRATTTTVEDAARAPSRTTYSQRDKVVCANKKFYVLPLPSFTVILSYTFICSVLMF